VEDSETEGLWTFLWRYVPAAQLEEPSKEENHKPVLDNGKIN